jgi:hypothetical protein
MRRAPVRTVAIATAAILLLIAARNRAVRPPGLPPPLSLTRSFEITDKAIVSAPQLTLERVLTQLIARAGVEGLTSHQLIRQLFDTQNPRPGLADANGPHCDDALTNGTPSYNGFPRRCPTPEGQLAANAELANEFFTIGIVNRFDLAPPDGANCGQYRMVFAHRDAGTQADFLVRRHLIFEAALPNPNPAAGLVACRPVAQFWNDLSAVDSLDERRARIERFFFDGLDGFAPVIDPASFADAGGIRTLQQVPGQGTERFYQFRLAKQCDAGACTLRFVPDVLENMPFGPLFDPRNDTPQGRAFRDELVAQIPTLVARDLNLFTMSIPRQYLMAESNPTDGPPAFDYTVAFDNAAQFPERAAYRQRVQAELDRLGSKVTPEQLILRAEETTCQGCHGFNGLNFGEGVKLGPGFFSLQMISEDVLQDGEAGPQSRYGVDPIVTGQFIPHRMQILREFLQNGTPPVHSN